MKKIIALILVIVCMMTLIGCGTGSKQTQSEEEKLNVEKVGEHYLYHTKVYEEYLSFLNDLDTKKYQLLDVSIARTDADAWYFITYKILE